MFRHLPLRLHLKHHITVILMTIATFAMVVLSGCGKSNTSAGADSTDSSNTTSYLANGSDSSDTSDAGSSSSSVVSSDSAELTQKSTTAGSKTTSAKSSKSSKNSSTAKVTADNIREDGSYTSKDDVALYIHIFGKLPSNYITKAEATALGWSGGSLASYAPGKCIGGDRYYNSSKALPKASGRIYKECDIDTLNANSRGTKRIVYSNDGLIYYTEDHYETFELLYG